MQNIKDTINQTDLILLQQQKLQLIDLLDKTKFSDPDSPLWGVVHFLDLFLDAAEKDGIFQYPEEDPEDPCVEENQNTTKKGVERMDAVKRLRAFINLQAESIPVLGPELLRDMQAVEHLFDAACGLSADMKETGEDTNPETGEEYQRNQALRLAIREVKR